MAIIQPRLIDHERCNAAFACDKCGNATVRIGIELDAIGNNRIRCLECAHCGEQTPVTQIAIDGKEPAIGKRT